jgi:hypothetical protein
MLREAVRGGGDGGADLDRVARSISVSPLSRL